MPRGNTQDFHADDFEGGFRRIPIRIGTILAYDVFRALYGSFRISLTNSMEMPESSTGDGSDEETIQSNSE